MSADVNKLFQDYLALIEELREIVNQQEAVLTDMQRNNFFTALSLAEQTVEEIIQRVLRVQLRDLALGLIWEAFSATMAVQTIANDIVSIAISLHNASGIDETQQALDSAQHFSQLLQDAIATLNNLRRRVFFPTYVTLSGIIDDGGQATAISSNLTIDTVREERAAFIFATP